MGQDGDDLDKLVDPLVGILYIYTIYFFCTHWLVHFFGGPPASLYTTYDCIPLQFPMHVSQ